MLKAPLPANEKERLANLYEYSLLDTMDEEEYDQITKMASLLCDVPISLISLIDRNRQWFKSRVGIESRETSRDEAFCAHAILEGEQILEVPDSREDERFNDNPLVLEDPNIVFYAGVPLISDNDMALGTLCVIDRVPRVLTDAQKESLKILADQVVKLFELHKASLQKDRYLKELEARNKSLEEFARVAAHDIKSPLASIKAASQMILSKPENLDEEQLSLMELLNQSSDQLSSLIEGILRHSRSNVLILEEKSWFSLPELVDGCMKMMAPLGQCPIKAKYPEGLNQIYSNRTAWQQIIINLLANAIKYNNNPEPRIKVKVEAIGHEIELKVCDNGPGILPEDQERIFKLFETTQNKDLSGSTGTGIGLATVKNIVSGLGGQIGLESKVGEGSAFVVQIPIV
ncbi:sensor histidine kinase [Croceimicrobium hydrocarbonivorans]|uniref:histidine kinase n=1 Tax=Croceimicrobium hydrocarbonivorans TaxID=2761580 RepID=A0A7H0VD35_9FLAO|nr:GAF domain-containing sensor histidine kinase [Croceimicrobium hydrocarbonivorans]QNR23633.1 GAF domain-containing sensor histidine kinase [Croceimicrobium hydrocarbonivorans]